MFGRKRSTPASYVQTKRGGLRTRLAESDVSVTTTAIQLLPNNPNRLAWEMVNNGIGRVDFTSKPPPVAGSSRPLGASGGFATMDAQDDGEATGWAQTGISAAGTNVVHITELIADMENPPDDDAWRR